MEASLSTGTFDIGVENILPQCLLTESIRFLPVPLGLSKGVVVFMCGALKHAGPHRAVLVVNGKRRAESKILQVIKYFRLYAILYNEGNK